MKKAIFFCILLATFFVANSTSHPSSKFPLKASEIFLPIGTSGQLISIQDLSTIKVKDFEKLTGKKMKLFDEIGFTITQKQLRKNINRDGTFNNKKIQKSFEKYVDGTTGFHAGGFLLGFLLGIIGVLIAFLIKDDKKKNRVKWACIGLAALVIIAIILVASGGGYVL